MSATPLVWDNHVCLPLSAEDRRFRGELVRHTAAGFNVVSINLGFGRTTFAEVLALLESFESWVADHEERYGIPRNLPELEAIVATGRTAVLFDLEGSEALLAAPERLPELARRGLRWALLVYNERNSLGSGCHVAVDEGLTAAGRRLVRQLEASGIVVCAAHAGSRTARDLLEFAEKPVIYSHANARAVTDHPRNVSDDLLALCAAKGGVIGLTGVGLFLGDPLASATAIGRHARHIADRVGSTHVGLALDYVYDQDELRAALRATQHLFPAGLGYSPEIQFAPPEHLGQIRDALGTEGFDAADVARICGGNWQRIARTCW